jgi:uncharacterized SAM-binding protein YcdF (DUF218 family)
MSVVSHILQFLLLPSGLLGVGLVICVLLVLVRPRGKTTKVAIVAVFGFYYLLGTTPMANLLIGSLERQVPPAAGRIDPEGLAAIVILAGASSGGGERQPAELNGASWRRLWRGVELYRQLGGPVPIVFSGGGPEADPTASGVLARDAATMWGVPPDRFWLENASGNTRDSGAFVKQLLDQRLAPRRKLLVALVTSAWHMPRAVAVFSRVGVDTVPVPCDFLSGAAAGVYGFVPTYEAFAISSLAIRELIGITAYKLGLR